VNYQRYWVVTESNVRIFGGGGFEDALAEIAYIKERTHVKPHLMGEKEDDTLEEICTIPSRKAY
jgi:hypothetical protein